MAVTTKNENVKLTVAANEKNEGNKQMAEKKVVFDTKELNLWYGEDHALKNINLQMIENEVTAIIGPSGCGKSTYIKTLNRMVEMIPIVRTSGDILYRGKNILDKSYKVEDLRTQCRDGFPKAKSVSKIHL